MKSPKWSFKLNRPIRFGFLILWVALLTFLMSPFRAMGWGPSDGGLGVCAVLMVVCLLPAAVIGMLRNGSWGVACRSYAFMVVVPTFLLELYFRPEEQAFLAKIQAAPEIPMACIREEPFDWCSMHYEPGEPVMVID